MRCFAKKNKRHELVSGCDSINKFDEIINYEGHFVRIKWNTNSLKIITDSQNLRPLYYSINNDGSQIILSTRLDWISKNLSNRYLDMNRFGSFWVLINQIEFKPFIKGIELVKNNCSISIDIHNKIKMNELI